MQKACIGRDNQWEVRAKVAIAFVNDLGLFVIVQLLEDTPPVLSPGRPKTTPQSKVRNTMQRKKKVPIVVPGLSRSTSKSVESTASTYVSQD